MDGSEQNEFPEAPQKMRNFRLYGANLRSVTSIILTIAIVAGGVWIYTSYFADSENGEGAATKDQTPNQTTAVQNPPESSVLETLDDFLIALESIYFASTYTEVDPESVQVDTLRNLMRQNDFLSRGKSQISKYLNHNDEYISTVAEGITQGTNAIIEANNNHISFLRNNDILNIETSELQYQVANYLTAQKRGYEAIFISTPFLIYVAGSPAENENPSGQIPYKITYEERQTLLSRIDQLFDDGFRQLENDRATGSDMNAVIIGVEHLRKNLSYNTYEEAAAAPD